MLQALIEYGRRRYAQLAPVDRGGVRAVLSALKHGEIVLMLPDQVPRAGEGVWEPFFGRPAYTMTLAARLSEVPRVRTFFYCGEILPRGGGYRLHFLEPDPPLDGDTRSRVAAINRNVEKLALRHPDQYLWATTATRSRRASIRRSAHRGVRRCWWAVARWDVGAPANDASRPPNILLISIDALRADRLEAYGYDRPTSPFLAELAGRGLVFENSSVNTHGTTPSHATILSGLYQEQHGVGLAHPRLGRGGSMAAPVVWLPPASPTESSSFPRYCALTGMRPWE